MREFAYGTDVKFTGLWNQLTAGAPIRIKFDVTVPKTDVPAKLVFATAGPAKVSVKLTLETATQPEYNGQSEDLRSLLSGNVIYCDSVRELKDVFSSMQADFAEERRTREEGESEQQPIRHILPVRKIDPVELANKVKEQIIGQDAQVEGIAVSISNHLRKPNPKKPLTVMLPGPTGTGKTATAKAFAEELQEIYGKDALPIITINCNEYKEEYRISQLLGSPAGYVGYGDGCVMEPVKNSDCVIIVFDEYEKAHRSIHTAVMNWMDTGIITLAKSSENGASEYDCKRSIIIMTSNINMNGASQVSTRGMWFRIGARRAVQSTINTRQANDRCRQVMVANGFKPEIASRIAYFFEYKQLTAEDICKIMILTFRNKAKEYGCNVGDIDRRLVNDIQSAYGTSEFGVRSLESDLDRILGTQIPMNLDASAQYNVSGRLDRMEFTRR